MDPVIVEVDEIAAGLTARSTTIVDAVTVEVALGAAPVTCLNARTFPAVALVALMAAGRTARRAWMPPATELVALIAAGANCFSACTDAATADVDEIAAGFTARNGMTVADITEVEEIAAGVARFSARTDPVAALVIEMAAGVIAFGPLVTVPENAEVVLIEAGVTATSRRMDGPVIALVALIAAGTSTSTGAIANEMYACGDAPASVHANVPTVPAAARAPSVTPKPPPPPLNVSLFARDARLVSDAFVQTGTWAVFESTPLVVMQSTSRCAPAVEVPGAQENAVVEVVLALATEISIGAAASKVPAVYASLHAQTWSEPGVTEGSVSPACLTRYQTASSSPAATSLGEPATCVHAEPPAVVIAIDPAAIVDAIRISRSPVATPAGAATLVAPVVPADLAPAALNVGRAIGAGLYRGSGQSRVWLTAFCASCGVSPELIVTDVIEHQIMPLSAEVPALPFRAPM